MSEEFRGLQRVNKKCYRNITVDASRQCKNGCKFCFDRSFDKWRQATIRRKGSMRSLGLDTIRRQLDSDTQLRRWLDTYKVVRIGALCDIKKDDVESYELTRGIMQMVWAHGYKYMIVTKSCHSIDLDMLRDIKRHEGMLSVTAGYYRAEHAGLFEDMGQVPVTGRRELLQHAIDMGIANTLRLNPIHPRYLDSALEMVEWYKSVGGTRIVMELLRIDPRWIPAMPGVDFKDYVTYSRGGFYQGYLTPHRELADKIYSMVTNYSRLIGIDKITVCADMDGNRQYGYRPGEVDCCQTTEIWDLPLPVIGE